jgi:hypothetical protein
MPSPETLSSVRNNVDWYDAIFRAHGLSGGVADGLWSSPDRAPPYYSNAVTVAPSEVRAQLAALRGLGAVVSPPWSVKDSFSVLDLEPLGFRPLFDAEWIWRAATDPPPRGSVDIAWQQVTAPAELEAWEAAWRANGSPARSPVFVPRLLEDPSIAVLAGYRDHVLVGGCVANRSADAVGISNVFAADVDELVMAGAIGEVARFGADLPVVGYEAGDALARATRLGFRAVGPLRIWLTVDGVSDATGD